MTPITHQRVDQHRHSQFTHRGRPPYDPLNPDCADCGDRQVLDDGRPCRCAPIGLAAELDLAVCRFAGSDPVQALEDCLRLILHRSREAGTHTASGAARVHATAWALAEFCSRLALEAGELCGAAVWLMATADAAEQLELEAAA